MHKCNILLPQNAPINCWYETAPIISAECVKINNELITKKTKNWKNIIRIIVRIIWLTQWTKKEYNIPPDSLNAHGIFNIPAPRRALTVRKTADEQLVYCCDDGHVWCCTIGSNKGCSLPSATPYSWSPSLIEVFDSLSFDEVIILFCTMILKSEVNNSENSMNQNE